MNKLPCQHSEWETVFLYEPAAKSLQNRLVGHITLYVSTRMGMTYMPMDKPQKTTIRVAFNHLRKCPAEIVHHECAALNALPITPTIDSTAPVEDIASPPVL